MRYIEHDRVPVNADRLWDEMKTAYPSGLNGLRTGPYGVVVRAEDEFTEDAGLVAIIEAHDPGVLSVAQVDEEDRKVQFAWLKTQFRPAQIQNDIDAGDYEAALNKMLQAMRALGRILRE